MKMLPTTVRSPSLEAGKAKIRKLYPNSTVRFTADGRAWSNNQCIAVIVVDCPVLFEMQMNERAAEFFIDA